MVRGFCVAFKTEKELHDAYVRDLAHGAVFVPSRAGAEPGTPVELEFDLAFAGQRLSLAGEVVGLVSAAMARAGATPGVSVLLAERGEALRRRLEEASGVALPVGEAEAPHPRRATAPFSARDAVVVEAAGCSFPAETVDMSYNGMLALLNGIDLGEGSPVRVWLTHPSTGASIDLDGRVANQTRCDHGVMAVGIQFDYALERVDEVARFIDELRGFHHAKKLASVCGSLEETRLEGVLETFAGISSAGTLALRRGEDEGKIAYADGQILYATTGLVSGAKALGRMFTWRDARFEFHPGVKPLDETREPLPLQSAVLTAAVEQDEIARLDLGGADADTVFELDAERLHQL